MPSLHPSRHGLIAAALIAAGLTPAARALERVNLRTGFSYDCTRTQPIDSSHVRLFLAGSSSAADNFIDLSTREIVSVETLPDAPPPSSPAAATPATTDFHDLLAHAGAQHNIDVELLASVVKAESDGRANAVSRAGAEGLMQLMPGTAQQLGVSNAFEPGQNIAGGAAYLDTLLIRYNNNLALALAAYNAGPAAVDRYHGIPPFRETRAYVARVENEFKRRKLALQRDAVVQTPAAQNPAAQTTLASR